MKSRTVYLGTLALAGCLATTMISPAVADESTPAAFEALQKVDIDNAAHSGRDILTSLAPLDVTQTGPDVVNEVVADSQVTVPSDPGDHLLISDEDLSLSVGIPGAGTSSEASVAAPNIVEFENTEGYSVFPIVKDDASVQFTTVIEDKNAPTTYDFAIGGDVVFIETTPDGFAVFTDSRGDFAGASLPAWAVDADGEAVPTHFEVRGNTLRQVVEHTKQGVTYPVVADPYMGKALISKVTKTTDKKKPRYSVKKTTWGNTIAVGYGIGPSEDPLLGASILRNQGWTEAVKKGTSTAKTIKQQYDCHTVFAAAKNPWNLEAHRSTRNNWLVSPKLCNW